MAKSKKLSVYGRIRLGNNYFDISESEYQEGMPEEIFLASDMNHLMARGMPAGTSIKLTISGNQVSTKYKDFVIELRGVAVYDPVKGPNRICLIFDGEPRGEWCVQVFQTDIYIKGMGAFIKQMWYSLIGWHTTIQYIQLIPSKYQSAQVSRLSKGLDLVTELVRRGRRPDPKRQNTYKGFVAAVNKNEDIARYLSDFAQKHIFGNWIKQLEYDPHYQEELCKGYDKAIIKEAEQVLCGYQKDKKLSKSIYDHAISPLGVAKIIAAVEMNLRNLDNSLLSINTLSEWYTKGGGHRWKKKSKQ